MLSKVADDKQSNCLHKKKKEMNMFAELNLEHESIKFMEEKYNNIN